MTWEQFVGAALGLALVALGRLLDKYLPPSHEPEPAPAVPLGPPEVTEQGDGSTMPPEAQ